MLNKNEVGFWNKYYLILDKLDRHVKDKYDLNPIVGYCDSCGAKLHGMDFKSNDHSVCGCDISKDHYFCSKECKLFWICESNS